MAKEKTVEQLSAELASLKAQLEERQKVTVVVPSNRKLQKYDGKTPVEDWIEEASSVLESNGLSGTKAASFIFTSLDGQARDEIRGRGEETRKKSDDIFAALRSVFGEKKTVSQLRQLMYSRTQTPSESLLEFAHSLSALADRLVRSKGCTAAEKDQLLRDQFMEGVHDCQLRWELAKKVQAEPACTFVQLRDLAEQWCTMTGREPSKKAGAKSVPISAVATTELQEVSACEVPQPDLLAKLVKLTEQNQQLLSSLAKRQEEVEAGLKRSTRPTCFYCGKQGHIQPECRKRKADLAKSQSPSQASTSNTITQASSASATTEHTSTQQPLN